MQRVSSLSRRTSAAVVVGVCLLVLAFSAPAVAEPLPSPTAGRLIATSGFDPKRDGFSFANWGEASLEHPGALDAQQMQTLFGDGVCVRIRNGACVLNATSSLVRGALARTSDGGHCFGMAALANLVYTGRVSLSSIAPGSASLNSLRPSPELDRVISRYFMTQYFDPTESSSQRLPVAQVLRELRAAWASGELPWMGIFGEVGGHAITPYAMRDLGDGRTGILVYDNNYPDETKVVVADATRNTWRYSTQLNPQAPGYTFVGTPENELELGPTAPLTDVHECPSCRGAGDDRVRVVVTDTDGFDSGARDVDWEPAIRTLGGPAPEEDGLLTDDTSVGATVGRGQAFEVSMSGVKPGPSTTVSITVIGDGWAYAISDMELTPLAVNTARFSADGRRVTMTSTTRTTPVVEIGTEDRRRSVNATVRGADVHLGSAVTVDRSTTGNVGVDVTGLTLSQPLGVTVRRSDAVNDAAARSSVPIAVWPGSRLSVPVGQWNGRSPLVASVRGAIAPSTQRLVSAPVTP